MRCFVPSYLVGMVAILQVMLFRELANVRLKVVAREVVHADVSDGLEEGDDEGWEQPTYKSLTNHSRVIDRSLTNHCHLQVIDNRVGEGQAGARPSSRLHDGERGSAARQ